MFSAGQPHHRARCTFQLPIDAQGVVGQRARKGKVNLQVFTSQHPEKWLVLPAPKKWSVVACPNQKCQLGSSSHLLGWTIYIYIYIYTHINHIYIYIYIKLYIYTFDNANCWVLLTHPLMNCVPACANSKKYGIPQGQNHYMNHHWSQLSIY